MTNVFDREIHNFHCMTEGAVFDGEKVVVSGSGNVAIYTIEKVEMRLDRLLARRNPGPKPAGPRDQPVLL